MIIHISESLKSKFWVKILKFFDGDPGWKKIGSGIRDGKKSDSTIKEIVRNPRVIQCSMDNGCPDPDPDQGFNEKDR